jgi:hypothetical protein
VEARARVAEAPESFWWHVRASAGSDSVDSGGNGQILMRSIQWSVCESNRGSEMGIPRKTDTARRFSILGKRL